MAIFSRRVAVYVALAAGVAGIMSIETASAADSAVVDARSIIGSLESPKAKTRGLSIAPRSSLKAESAAPAERKIDLDVPFANGSARVTEAANRQLEQLGAALTAPELHGARFLIAGHTSATGSSGRNRQLSEQRARAVRDYLLQRFSIAPDRLEAVGFGATHLLPNFAADAAQQRRVEVSAQNKN